MTNTNFDAIYREAKEAAIAACDEALKPYGGVEPRTHMECGFAWVVVRPATSPFIRWCRKQGLGRKNYEGGWLFWNPTSWGGQFMTPKAAGAAAFAEVLRKHGIDARADCRLD